MNKVTLYQKDSKGRTKVWTMEVIAKALSGELHSTSGLEGGKLTLDITVITEGKNAGKVNETTPLGQARAEAQSKIDKKIREGYVADKNQIKESSELGSGIKSPMLAHKYCEDKSQSGSKNLKDLGLEGKKIFVQRKKDGNRCKIVIDNKSVTMWTRKGDQQPLLTHITNTVVANFLRAYDMHKQDVLILDGELYTKEFSFNKLNGLIKKQKKTAEDIELCKAIKFHLYDVELPMSYEKRYEIIQHFASDTVHIEEAEKIVATTANINIKLEKYLEEGEEGLMIRTLDMPYENKRSWSLLKVKIFEDAEFEVVGFEESVKGGMVGAVVCKLPKPSIDRDGKPIVTFKAGLKLSHEECTEIWNNQNKYIGKQGTVEYFSVSEYQVPRFPKFKTFRD